MVIRVYSTATNGTEYCEWHPPVDAGGLPLKGRSVHIKGGAGIAQRRTLITPLGNATVVSQEDLDFLEKLPSFQKHKAAGFITVSKGNADANKVAADMSQRDGSSPLMPGDYKDAKAPKAGADMPVSELSTQPRYAKKRASFG